MKYNDIPQIRIFKSFLKYHPEYEPVLETIAQDLCDTSRALLMPSNQECANLLLKSLIIDDHTMSRGHSVATRDIWHRLVHRDTYGERLTEEDKKLAAQLRSISADGPPPAFLNEAFERLASQKARELAQGLNETNRKKIIDLVATRYLVAIADIVNEAAIVALQDKEYVRDLRDTAVFTASRKLTEDEISRTCHHQVTSEMNESLAFSIADLIEEKFMHLRKTAGRAPDNADGPAGPSANA